MAMGIEEAKALEDAGKDVVRELEQGFQSLELKLHTVPCSRGDFAFTTITFGQWKVDQYDEREKGWLYMIGKVMLQVRRNGHGKDHKPVVFPKLVFLYDEKQIKEDPFSAGIFDEAVKTSTQCGTILTTSACQVTTVVFRRFIRSMALLLRRWGAVHSSPYGSMRRGRPLRSDGAISGQFH